MGRLIGLVVGVGKTRVGGFADLPAIGDDVDALAALLRYGETGPPLVNEAATVNEVHSAISSWHSKLTAGDTFVFAYSGHGSQRDEKASVEADRCSEALVLFDGEYRDSMLRSALHGFVPGVDVVAIIDACHGAGSTYIVKPQPSAHGVVHRRGLRVPGATSLTLAAASEAEDANQVIVGNRSYGQLVDCVSRAWDGGHFDGSWQDLWDLASRWWRGLGYEPAPEAWLDGPDPTDDALLRATALRAEPRPA